MLNWIIENKEWLFSGVGVSAIVSIVALILRRKRTAGPEQQQSPSTNGSWEQAEEPTPNSSLEKGHVYLFLHPFDIQGLGTRQDEISYAYLKVMIIDCSDLQLIVDTATITVTNTGGRDIGASANATDTPFTIEPKSGRSITFRVNFTDAQLRLIETCHGIANVRIETRLSLAIRGRDTALTIAQMTPGAFHYESL